jgi:hypothetical protein
VAVFRASGPRTVVHRDPTRGRARRTAALRSFLQSITKLRAEIGGRAVFVWFPGGGFGDRGVVEFGELSEVLLLFSLGGILQ